MQVINTSGKPDEAIRGAWNRGYRDRKLGITLCPYQDDVYRTAWEQGHKVAASEEPQNLTKKGKSQ